MKYVCNVLAAALLAAASARAAVPVAWTNRPATPQPVALGPVPHGVPVDFRVTLRGYSAPPAAPGADVRLWYQTNGMGSAWWSAPATLDGDTVTASFGPAQDAGADRVNLFFGAPSNFFASAVLRLTHSPGFAPNALPLPARTLDFAAVEVANLHALTNGWSLGGAAVIPGEVSSLTNAARYYGGPPSPAMTYGWFFDGAAAYAGSAARLSPPQSIYGIDIYDSGGGNMRWASRNSGPGAATNFFAYVSELPDLARFAETGEVAYARGATSTSYAAEAGAANRLYDSGQDGSYTATDLAAAARRYARACRDYKWSPGQSVLYRLDIDDEGYMYMTPVTNVNALAEGNEHILFYLEDHRDD